MENAVKALLIAAGVFFALLILSTLVAFSNKISAFYNAKHEATVIEQTKEFNEKFDNYNRNNIRGNDLISLMNRIIDYNAQEAYFEDKNYKRILVNIDIGHQYVGAFRYEINGAKVGAQNELIKKNITNTGAGGTNYTNDRQLIAITETPPKLKNLAKNAGFSNINEAQLQQLSSNISNIMIDETHTDSSSIYNRYYRTNILKNLLNWDVDVINKNEWKSTSETDSKMNVIKNITNQYYQYTQFKRALFDCTKMEYDDETNRIVEMEFKLQTKGGKVVFD